MPTPSRQDQELITRLNNYPGLKTQIERLLSRAENTGGKINESEFFEAIEHTHGPLSRRRAGVLLHITSLPSNMGLGTLGEDARKFIGFLKDNGLSVWQVLPIHPLHRVPPDTPHHDFLSPYQPMSAFAGNPMLIDVSELIEQGWLPQTRLPIYQRGQELEKIFTERKQFITKSHKYFFEHATANERDNFREFIEENVDWLEDYACFCVLKDMYDDTCWWDWPENFRQHNLEALNKLREDHISEIERYYFEQFVFFYQWQKLKVYAQKKCVCIFGDIPFFMALDSVDVWAHREYFQLEDDKPIVLSGTKERCWGHPLYDWQNLEKDGFQWWLQRFKMANELFELARLTNFHGYRECWAIPALQPPDSGEWQKTPGEALLKAIQDLHLPLCLISDDINAPEKVFNLRKQFGILGMKLLQFAFDAKFAEAPLKNAHLPHHYKLHDVVYTGTHDSNTALEWFQNLSPEQQKTVCDYLNVGNDKMPCALIRAIYQSVAKLAIVPMQDILRLDEIGRMNNLNASHDFKAWHWQFGWEELEGEMENKLIEMTKEYERI